MKPNTFEGGDLNAGYAEEIRIKHLFKKQVLTPKAIMPRIYVNTGCKGAKLNPEVFKPCQTADATEVCADNLIKDSQIGRLTISWTSRLSKRSTDWSAKVG